MTADGIGIGVLGCADIAARRTIPAILGAGMRLAAVASRSGDKARAFADRFGGVAIAGYRRLLERDDVDAVYIPLPIGMHEEWAAAALEAGKHVLVEKAATADPRAARRLVGLAAERGLLLMENFTFLQHSQHAEVGRLVAEGAIGRPRLFTGEFGFPLTDRSTIRHHPELGGGSLLDAGCYPVRAAQLFLGGSTNVLGSTLDIDECAQVDVAGSALLGDGNGMAAQCSFGFVHSYRNTYAIWGETGRIQLGWAFTPPATTRPVLRIERQDHVEERVLPADDQWVNTIRKFADLTTRPAEHEREHGQLVRQAALMEAVARCAR
ncbi:Gfo/Idh/MocA family protein [Streptomyces morookaense]|uniref:Gfo/Idh/MocA family protein n=1 Tax=Streptomyces morookaense TaxID=1970 RepID=UPI0019CCDD26|nr:Gfo/Idh/MocA family oxidoreductase [Streptomyces morookaense]GHF28255.1 oxidoreductase [Streptomyces morookaense]